MNGVSVVMYHYVRPLEDTAYPRIRGLTTTGFDRQLDWLQAHTQLVSMDEFLLMLEAGEAPDRPTALLTFDDGLRDHVHFVVPRLIDRGIRGAFYVPSSPVLDHRLLDVQRIHFILASVPDAEVPRLLQRCMPYARDHLTAERWSELRQEVKASRFDTEDVILLKRLLQRELPRDARRELTAELFRTYVSADEASFAAELYLSMSDLREMQDAGMHIGSHADSHEWLTNLGPDAQERELVRSLELLRSIGAHDRWTLAYPYGAFNEHTLDVASGLGCAAAFTTTVGPAPMHLDRRLQMPRYDTNDFPQ